MISTRDAGEIQLFIRIQEEGMGVVGFLTALLILLELDIVAYHFSMIIILCACTIVTFMTSEANKVKLQSEFGSDPIPLGENPKFLKCVNFLYCILLLIIIF